MAKLPRKNQKVFAQNALANQLAKFGSLAQGAPEFSTDPEVIQALSRFESGWFQAVLGNSNPTIEDMNSLFYLAFYQLAYLMQTGVAEWNASTTYYIGSVVNDGNGGFYRSIQDTNLNHATSDAAWWVQAGGSGGGLTGLETSTNVSPALNGKMYEYGTLSAPRTLTLPTGTSAFVIGVVGSASATNYLDVIPGAGTINGVADTDRYRFSNFNAIYYRAEGSTDIKVARQSATLYTNRGPTVQKFTSGSGTYTTPSSVAYIRVRMVGGGGGGGGSGSAGGSAGGTGGNTTFGSSLLVANGGIGGGKWDVNTGGAGGSASLGTGPIGIASTGGQGSLGGFQASTGSYALGGAGAATPFGGAGGGSHSAIANTGSGGGGSNSGGGVANSGGGGGGGAGGFVDAVINAPSATYAYAVGAAGAGGTAGSNGATGLAGGSGFIIVEEFYL